MDESGEVETATATAPAATTATGGRVAPGVPEPSTEDVDPVESADLVESVFRAEYRRLVGLARVLLDRQT